MTNTSGEKLNNFIKNKTLVEIISANQQKILSISKISKVVVIGSSGTGKTTLIDSIRDYCAKSDCVDIPTRYCTRNQRNSDNIENVFLSKNEFIELEKEKKLTNAWKRWLGNGHLEYYGFSKTDSGVLPIYSANNGILKYENTELIDSETLIIGITCDENIRHKRLVDRDPGYFDGKEVELNARLADPVDSVSKDTHLSIDTSGSNKELTAREFQKVIEKVVQLFITTNQIRSTGVINEKAHGRIFRLFTEEHLLPNGKKVDFEFAERSPGVRIITTDGKRVLITKEHRIETSNWDHRLPGGKVWDHLTDYISAPRPINDRVIELAAQKELSEEAGIYLPESSFKIMHTSKCGATVKWDLYYVLAIVPSSFEARSILTSEGEHVISNWFEYADAIKLCLEGEISEDRTLGVLLKFLLNSSLDKAA